LQDRAYFWQGRFGAAKGAQLAETRFCDGVRFTRARPGPCAGQGRQENQKNRFRTVSVAELTGNGRGIAGRVGREWPLISGVWGAGGFQELEAGENSATARPEEILAQADLLIGTSAVGGAADLP
jgi:hypothetical protein